ncbi:MAG TPA: GNAT family N-acetyltransferase [Caproiciproducens sp.]|nr:GNAT family N-acetyltransferase [Caproiciproducens sp.]
MRGKLETERLVLLLSSPQLAGPVAAYFRRNRDFLKDTEPVRDEEFFTPEFQRTLLENDKADAATLRSLRYWIAKKQEPEKVIGMAALNGIVMGAFQSSYLSYRLDKNEINKGYITEAIKKCVGIAFSELRLHRLEANIMPRNTASLRVAEKLGFVNEGVSREYLKINGVWEDHIHMVLLNRQV